MRGSLWIVIGAVVVVVGVFVGLSMAASNSSDEAVKVCGEVDFVMECFDSETELVAAYPDAFDGDVEPGDAACASPLKLYENDDYTGDVLWLTSRAVGHNLDQYGWDNRASSIQTGDCEVLLSDARTLEGDFNQIGANQQIDTLDDWNNVASSVVIR